MDPRKIPPYTFVRLEFADSNYVRGWHYPAGSQFDFGDDALLMCQAAGWVVDCSDEYVAISYSLTDQGGALNPLFIPWGAVTSLEELDVAHRQ